MKLHLIRHSLTKANEDRCYCGVTDLPLSSAGVQLAREKARAGGYPDSQSISFYTSGMKRAEETFALLFGTRPHEALPAFREMHFGCFEGKTYEQLKGDPAYQRWLHGDNEANVCPGGESGRQMYKRVYGAADWLVCKGREALVLCHGGPIAALMARYFPQEGRSRYQWQPQPAEGYTIWFQNKTPVGYAPVPRTGF